MTILLSLRYFWAFFVYFLSVNKLVFDSIRFLCQKLCTVGEEIFKNPKKWPSNHQKRIFSTNIFLCSYYCKTTFFSRGSIFCRFRDFLKIRENQTPGKLPNSMIIVEKTREPRTLDPAESYKAADRENRLPRKKVVLQYMYVVMSLHAKHFVCRSNGVCLVTNTKTKRKKI